MTAVPTPTTPKPGRRFRLVVGTLMVGMVLLQAVLLLGLGYLGSKKLLYNVGHAAHAQEHARLEADIRGFMASAISAVSALAAAPQLSAALHGEDRSSELIWSLMSASRALDHLYFVDHGGELIGVQRYPEPALRRIHSQGTGFVEIYESKPGLEQLTLDSARRYATSGVMKRPFNDDLRSRSWFIQSLKAGTATWSEPHQLAFSRDVGVTFAVPDTSPDEKGNTDGVAAGDISLRQLVGFVRSFSHAGVGESAILTADGRVLARSDRQEDMASPDRPAATDILTAIALAVEGRDADVPAMSFGGHAYLVRSTAIPGTGWRLVSWLPEEVVTGGLQHSLLIAAGVMALCLVSALLVSLWLSRRVTDPIEALAGVARRIGRLDLQGLPRIQSPVEEINQLGLALDESGRSLRAFRKFVPADVVNELVKQGKPLEPDGRLMELTVMFTDIANFTHISASVPPGVLMPQLTEYFNAVAEILVAHGGTIDKYMGDGMMVLWGAPAPLDDAPYRACRAALAIRDSLGDLNAQWEARGLRRLDTRIGINTGAAVVGVLGSSERLSFTAFGDTVNVASRIEALNKDHGTSVLASGHTVAGLGGRMSVRPLGEVELRGRPGHWTVFEIVDEIDTGGSAQPLSKP